MSDFIFSTALIMFAGYVMGKIFKGFNPFLVAIGLLFLLFISPIFAESKNEYIAYAAFGFGLILNFNRPVTHLREWIHDFVELISFRRLATNYADNIDIQKAEAEAELNRKKKEIEEELRRQKQEDEAEIKRQKYQAEQDLERQRREAKEDIRRDAENFKREQERAKAEQQRHDEQRRNQQSNSQSRQSNSKNSHSNNGNKQSSQSSNRDSSHLDPKSFADACEIMGKGQGCSLSEYKAAYKKLMNLNHPDKVYARTGSKAEQEKAEHKTKQLNVAWETIKKKLT